MKCTARLSDNPERTETCQNEATYKLVFSNGAEALLCNEHNEESKKIERLIVSRISTTLPSQSGERIREGR